MSNILAKSAKIILLILRRNPSFFIPFLYLIIAKYVNLWYYILVSIYIQLVLEKYIKGGLYENIKKNLYITAISSIDIRRERM